MKNRNIVIVYAKWPKKGKTKTRISKALGKDLAYQLSISCLDDLVKNIAHKSSYDLVIGADNKQEAALFEKKYGIKTLISKSERKGSKQEKQSVKFHTIFSALLNQQSYEKAILIPMDVPYLTEKDLIRAFNQLENVPFVFGPEHNGGVYLIGVNGPYFRNIFEGVRWSTENSFIDLVTNARGFCAQLRYLDDINEFEDVFKVKSKIELLCPSVYALLAHNINLKTKSNPKTEVLYGDY